MRTGSGESVLRIARLAVGATATVVTLAVLSADTGSVIELVAVAVFVIVPAVDGRTTMVMVAEPPLFITPKLQTTVADPEHVPWLGVAETRVTLDGSTSVTTTPVAVSGPLLTTDTEYVS